MKKPASSGVGGSGAPLRIPACDFSSRYPCLWDFLCETTWDDGTERQPGTVLIATGEGRARVWLHDRDGERSAWLSAATIQGALDAAEDGLDGECLEWRSNKVQEQRKYGKKS